MSATPEPPEPPDRSINPYNAPASYNVPASSGHAAPQPPRRGPRTEILVLALGLGAYLGMAAFFITCNGLVLPLAESTNQVFAFLMVLASCMTGIAVFCLTVWGILKANQRKA